MGKVDNGLAEDHRTYTDPPVSPDPGAGVPSSSLHINQK